MAISEILFFVLAILCVACAFMVIINRNPVHSVLFLIGLFFGISGLYILLNAQFLAIVNIIVYAGAIMVLFLFVVMLMNLNKDTEPQRNKWVTLMGFLSGGCLMLVLVASLKSTELKQRITRSQLTPETAKNFGIKNFETSSDTVFTISKKVENGGDIGLIENLGQTLFSEYVFPFEISSILFLSAMVGAVVLGKKEKKEDAQSENQTIASNN
jgi:NADH-quinone oxidoreductase subunit J